MTRTFASLDQNRLSQIKSFSEGLEILQNQFTTLTLQNHAFLLMSISHQINEGNFSTANKSLINGRLRLSLDKLFDNLDILELGSLINICTFLRKANHRGMRLSLDAKDFKNLESRLDTLLGKSFGMLQSQKSQLDLEFKDVNSLEKNLNESQEERSAEEKSQIKQKNRAYKKYAQDVKDYESTLSTLLFDFKGLGMNTKHLNQLLLTQIEEKMKMKNGKMSPESVLQILKACSSNYYDVKLHERILCDKLLMLANNWLEDFDFNQRSELAVAIAKLRFDINPPRFFYPQSLDLILKSLSDNLSSLSLRSLTDLIELYLFLPKHFDFSFLAKIKFFITETLEKEPEKLRVATVIRILRNLLQLRQKRKEKESSELAFALVENLTRRIQKRDPYAIKSTSELCETLLQYKFESQELAQALLDLNYDEVLEFYPNVQILEFLVMHDINIEKIVSRVKTINYSKTPEFILIRLLLLKNAQSRLNFCFSLSEQNEISVSSISYICESPFIQGDNSLRERMIKSIQTLNDFSNVGVLKSVFSLFSKFNNLKPEMFQQQIEKMSFAATRRCIEVFFTNQQYCSSENAFRLFLSILKVHSENINFSVIHNYVSGSQEFQLALSEHPECRELFVELVELFRKDSEIAKLSRLQSFMTINMAFQEYGVRSNELISLMQELYPKVLQQYHRISDTFIIKYTNFVRQTKHITPEQLDQVLTLLSKSDKPNLKIIELFLAEKQKAGPSQKKTEQSQKNASAQFLETQLVPQALFCNKRIIQACTEKICYELEQMGIQYSTQTIVGSALAPIFLPKFQTAI